MDCTESKNSNFMMHGIAQRIQILCLFLNSKNLTVFQNVVSLPVENFEKVKSNHGHRRFSSSVVSKGGKFKTVRRVSKEISR